MSKSIGQIIEEVAKDFNATVIYSSNQARENFFGHIHCPVNAFDCPYFQENGTCGLYPEKDPIDECDDFAIMWEIGDDYICYEDDIL